MPLTRNYLDVRLMDNEYSSDNFYNLFPYYDAGEPSEGKREVVVMDREKTDERSGIILEKYKVGVDRSGDLISTPNHEL